VRDEDKEEERGVEEGEGGTVGGGMGDRGPTKKFQVDHKSISARGSHMINQKGTRR
jgi:hypothetical protein